MSIPASLGVHLSAHPFHMDLSRESKPALREPWMALYIPFGSRPRYHRIRLGHMADDLRGLQPHALLGALGHALCALPRYGGQTPAPYSVGAHSLALALYTLRASFSPIATPQTHNISYPDAMFALVALIHDGPEGLGLGDIISPIKRALGGVTKAWEDATERAILAALEPSSHWQAQGVFRYDAMREAVGALDLRILLDEQAHILGSVPHPWDDLLGIGPLRLPQGPFLALAQLRPQVAALLFVALGVTLCGALKPRDARPCEPFAQALHDALDDALTYAPPTVTRADVWSAHQIALGLLTDAPHIPDKQPCTFPPAAFLRRAQPYALEDFCDRLHDPHAGSEQAAHRLCVWGQKFGFEARIDILDGLPNGEAEFGVFMHNVHGHSVTFHRTKTEDGEVMWGVLDTYAINKGPAPSVQDLFAEEMPADLYRMALRSHPLSAQGVHLLYLTRLLMGGGRCCPVGSRDLQAYNLAGKLQAFGVEAEARPRKITGTADMVVILSPHMNGACIVPRDADGSAWVWEDRPTMDAADLAARILNTAWTVPPCEVL